MLLTYPLTTFLVYVTYASGQNCPLKGISSYAKITRGHTMRHTTIQNGNYTIQALITFTKGMLLVVYVIFIFFYLDVLAS